MILYLHFEKKVIKKYCTVIELCTDENKMRMIRNRVSDYIIWLLIQTFLINTNAWFRLRVLDEGK